MPAPDIITPTQLVRLVGRLSRRRLILAAGRAVPRSALAQPRRVRQDFEAAATGSLPPGLSPGLTGGGPSPCWAVVEDLSPPTGPRVLAETRRDRTATRFPRLVVDGFEFRDVAVSVCFRPIDGGVDQAAGLVARANALEDNVRLYRVIDRQRIRFAGTDVRVPRDRWQALGLTVRSDRLEVSLDGRVLFAAMDRTFAEAGRHGVWTKADSLVHFDALDAEELR